MIKVERVTTQTDREKKYKKDKKMRFTRWGMEHGMLVLCTVATAGTLGHMYYRKKNDLPYKVKIVKDESGFNDVISYTVYNLYQLKEKYYPSDPDAPKGPTLAEKRMKRHEQLQTDLDLLRKKYGVPTNQEYKNNTNNNINEKKE